MLHGLNDTVVAPEQLRRFCTAMQQAGNRDNLMFVKNARHDFVMPENTSTEPA